MHAVLVFTSRFCFASLALRTVDEFTNTLHFVSTGSSRGAMLAAMCFASIDLSFSSSNTRASFMSKSSPKSSDAAVAIPVESDVRGLTITVSLILSSGVLLQIQSSISRSKVVLSQIDTESETKRHERAEVGAGEITALTSFQVSDETNPAVLCSQPVLA